MKPCKPVSQRRSSWQPRRECARDTVSDVDPMNIDVRIGDHSEAPLEHWQDRLKEKRRKQKPPKQNETPATPTRRSPPDALIDEYAGPRGFLRSHWPLSNVKRVEEWRPPLPKGE